MTRVIVYSTALVAFIAATAMTFASIFIPNWISYTVGIPNGDHLKLGLHKKYSSVTDTYKHYPQAEDCINDRYFCSMWRTTGFLMSFAAVGELVTIVAYVVVLGGGKQKRETGWKVLCFMLALVGIVQCASMAIVAYLYDHDEQFFPGWKLSEGWILCTISWSICLLSALFIWASAYVFPSEGDYELIPSERNNNGYGY